MPYITSIERMGREEGRQEGREEGREIGRLETLREGVLDVIETRFGPAPASLRERINTSKDVDRLKAWHKLAVTCAALRDFEIATHPV